MAIIASVLVIIYSATGLARDSGFPGGFVRDINTGELIPATEENFPAREVAMLINLALILLGVLDILFTLPCCIICLRYVTNVTDVTDLTIVTDVTGCDTM